MKGADLLSFSITNIDMLCTMVPTHGRLTSLTVEARYLPVLLEYITEQLFSSVTKLALVSSFSFQKDMLAEICARFPNLTALEEPACVFLVPDIVALNVHLAHLPIKGFAWERSAASLHLSDRQFVVSGNWSAAINSLPALRSLQITPSKTNPDAASLEKFGVSGSDYRVMAISPPGCQLAADCGFSASTTLLMPSDPLQRKQTLFPYSLLARS
ncbi:hypothetical protein EON65_29725 [archaeon]|nr:MAG: hypothetical protein EON65_29725 [archaeon]